jgi:hypothetical protein
MDGFHCRAPSYRTLLLLWQTSPGLEGFFRLETELYSYLYTPLTGTQPLPLSKHGVFLFLRAEVQNSGIRRSWE